MQPNSRYHDIIKVPKSANIDDIYIGVGIYDFWILVPKFQFIDLNTHWTIPTPFLTAGIRYESTYPIEVINASDKQPIEGVIFEFLNSPMKITTPVSEIQTSWSGMRPGIPFIEYLDISSFSNCDIDFEKRKKRYIDTVGKYMTFKNAILIDNDSICKYVLQFIK